MLRYAEIDRIIMNNYHLSLPFLITDHKSYVHIINYISKLMIMVNSRKDLMVERTRAHHISQR